MEYHTLHNTDIEINRVTLGTWAIGGFNWGGTDVEQSIATILESIDQGVKTIDTAPIYGKGTSEEIVAKAIKEYGNRDDLVIATKVGLEWDDHNVWRNSSRDRIRKEIEDSLKRLEIDQIDIYQVHWPDLTRPQEEVGRAMFELLDEGLIRSVGVSNYNVAQMEAFSHECPIHVCQPPYNIFERDIEDQVMPYCEEHNITLLTYSAICRGMLSGKMSKERNFEGDDIRNVDPKFQGERFDQYLEAVEKLETFADEKYDKSVLHLAVRWILDMGVESAILGARSPKQVTFKEIFGWELTAADLKEINQIVDETIEDPAGPEYMAPPTEPVQEKTPAE